MYVILLIAIPIPPSGPIQLRIADCLIPLAALFGWPAIAGVTLGCFVGNAYFWLGPQDVILGPIVNLVAATIIFMLRRKPFMACVVGSLPIGVIVGGYLWFFFGFGIDVFGLQLPMWAAMIISITISTLIAVAGIGYTLLKALSSSSVATALRMRGIKLYIED